MIKIKRRPKFNYKFFLLILFIFICLITLSISMYNIILWKIQSNKTNKLIEKMQNIVTIDEISNNDNTEIIKNSDVEESNPYWDYINMDLINVDFKELKNINDQVKGWIQVNGTNINYPFLQTNNNKYYLTHSFDKSYNQAGWVFLDYRNDINNLGKNNIIYAHRRLDKTMFGSLKNILSSDWLENDNNFVVKLSTETENTLWQVFSVYHIPTTNDYIQTDFSSDESFKNFTNMIINRSAFNFNTSVGATDKILTLSTCYNNTDKVVLHAKLIKRESR